MLMSLSARADLKTPVASATLPAALPPGLGLQARCAAPSCGARAAIDPGPWLAQGLAGAPLERLETRLRCACGARRAALEIVGGPPPGAARPAIYIFV